MRGGKTSNGMARKVISTRDPIPSLPNPDESSPVHSSIPRDSAIANGFSTTPENPILHHETPAAIPNEMNASAQVSEDDEEVTRTRHIYNTPTGTRPFIEVFNNTFAPLKPAFDTLKHIIHSHYDGPYRCFSEVHAQTVMLWWNEFKNSYQWEKTCLYDDVVFKAFKHKASDHIRNTMAKVRITGVRQPWMAEDMWKVLVNTWKEDPRFLHRSETNKRNRAVATENGVPVYTGGSISVSAHKRRLKDVLKRESTPKETFEKCYTKKDEILSGKAKETVETYDKLVDEATQLAATSEGSFPVDVDRLWIEAAGGVKKGRIFGMGSEARGVLHKTQYTKHSAPPSSAYEVNDYENLKEEMRTTVQEVREEVTTVRTEVSRNNQQWQKMFDQLIKGQNALSNTITGLAKKTTLRKP